MKPSACIINTARGAIIDETALIEALQQHRLAGAGLDVQEVEPPVADSPLYTMEHVILTPHMGWKGLEHGSGWCRSLQKMSVISSMAILSMWSASRALQAGTAAGAGNMKGERKKCPF